MKKNGSVVRKFSLVSFLVIFLLATGISLGVSSLIKGQVLGILAQVTAEYVQGLLHNQVNVETVSEKHHTELSRLFQQGILGEKIKGVKIWDASGEIIFADEESLIGQRFTLTEDISRALQGEVLAKVKRLDPGTRLKSVKSNRILEVHAPMKNSQGVIIGAYEIYWDMDLLYQSASRAYYIVGLLFLLGFGVLYVSLYRFFKSASDTIEQQNTSLQTLQERLGEALTENEATYLGTVKALLTALDAKDNYTAGHSVRVADLAWQTGRLLGFPQERLKLLEEAALFHDIGKIGVREDILNKPGRLSQEEFEEVKKHPVIGAQIIGAINSLADRALVLRHHHERYDGTGYPDGLSGEEIPLESRILAVADTYDAITSHRPYHPAQSPLKAISVLKECSGTQLDPVVVEAFLAAIRRKDSRIYVAEKGASA